MEKALFDPRDLSYLQGGLQVDLNVTQAAIRAGYSAKTARFVGSENLAKLNIQEYIDFTVFYRDWVQTDPYRRTHVVLKMVEQSPV